MNFLWECLGGCRKGILGRLPLRNCCPAHLNAATPWSPLFAHYIEAPRFTRRNRKGNKERGGLRCRKSRAAAREEQGGAEADGDCPCLSGPLFSSVGSRKAGLSRVAQVPFIGLTSMTSRRFGWSPSVCPGSHHPQGRRVSWAGVAGRARIQNTGLGSERGSGGCRICRVTGPSR